MAQRMVLVDLPLSYWNYMSYIYWEYNIPKCKYAWGSLIFFFKFCILYLYTCVNFILFISNKDTVVHVHTMYNFALNLLHVRILLHLIDCAKKNLHLDTGQSERVCILHLILQFCQKIFAIIDHEITNIWMK